MQRDAESHDLEDLQTRPRLEAPNRELITHLADLLSSIQAECDRFNSSAQFLNPRDHLQRSRELTANARGNSDAVRGTLLEAQKSMQAALKRLRIDIDRFAAHVPECANPAWYRNVDIIKLQDSQLSEALSKYPIPDILDFARHAKDVFTAEAKRHDAQDYNGRKFACSVRQILRFVILEDQPARQCSMSLLVFAKVKFATHVQFRIADQAALLELAEFIDESLDVEVRRPLPSKHFDRRFYNFPHMWRAVVYTGTDCVETKTGLMEILDGLGAKAVAEMRARTSIAVNERLPAELCEAVVQYVALTEEIPLEYLG